MIQYIRSLIRGLREGMINHFHIQLFYILLYFIVEGSCGWTNLSTKCATPFVWKNKADDTELVPSKGWLNLFSACCSPARLWNIWNSKCLECWRISNCRTAHVPPFGNWTQFEKGMSSPMSILSRKCDAKHVNRWPKMPDMAGNHAGCRQGVCGAPLNIASTC